MPGGLAADARHSTPVGRVQFAQQGRAVPGVLMLAFSLLLIGVSMIKYHILSVQKQLAIAQEEKWPFALHCGRQCHAAADTSP